MQVGLFRSRAPRRHNIAAFTMIELLAAITILMIIVSIMSVIFTESDRAWTQGTSMVERNTEGRAALNMIGHDLQYALADEMLTFAMREDAERGDDMESYGFLNSEICFVSLVHQPEDNNNPRASQRIVYYVKERTVDDNSEDGLGRYQLMRVAINTGNDSIDAAYDHETWYEFDRDAEEVFDNTAIIAENVTALAFFAPDGTGDIVKNYLSTDKDNDNRLPEYVDVYLEVMGEKDAIRAAQLKTLAEEDKIPEEKITEFVENYSRRYTARVYFQNRAGYKTRR